LVTETFDNGWQESLHSVKADIAAELKDEKGIELGIFQDVDNGAPAKLFINTPAGLFRVSFV
jgi:hypothetical protein